MEMFVSYDTERVPLPADAGPFSLSGGHTSRAPEAENREILVDSASNIEADGNLSYNKM